MKTLVLCTFWLATAVAAFGCDRGGTGNPPPARIDEPAEKTLAERTLEALARSPHGLYSLSTENRIRLEQIRRDPAPYLAVIRGKYPLGAVAPLARDQRSADAFTITAALLGEVDSPAAVDILTPWWVELDDALLAARDPTATEMLERMQREVFLALRSHPSDVVIFRILDRLERMDRPKRVDSLHYLLRSSQGNAEVVRRLRLLHDAPTSRLRGNQDLAKAIPWLSGDRRAPGGKSEGR